MTPRIYRITKKKYEELVEELRECMGPTKEKLKEALHIAREEGDPRECDAMTVTLNDFVKNDWRIIEITKILKHCEIIDEKKYIVEIDGVRKEICLCDSLEADPLNGKISINSPLGNAIMEKKNCYFTPKRKKVYLKVINSRPR